VQGLKSIEGHSLEVREMNLAKAMERDWDDRARKDAFFYIASWRKNWDLAAFLQSGQEDYQRLVAPPLERAAFSPTGKTMLELGCGAGRMTHVFADRFERVVAFDVSAEMLGWAQEILHDKKNIAWLHGNGENLGDAGTESVDFVFTYLVLQHLPEEERIRAYIREMLRVLRPEGLCLFQFNGSKRPTMNWKGHLVWAVVDALWALRLRGLARALADLLGFDAEMAGKSWHGKAIASSLVAAAIRASGGTVLEMNGEDTAMAWCCARKTDLLTKVANKS
jgi:ubiquinone/menaquinone biosynthesis C-methylase UbiE